MSGTVEIARGARHAEALVLEAIQAHAEAVRADPTRLARPLQVVVPSQSLRSHLAAAALRESGGALAGVVVRTLHGLAHEILGRCGAPLARGDALVPVLTRRCASLEPELRSSLEDLEDGYGAAAISVSDLIDAGFEPDLAGPIDDALAEEAPGAARERARALVRVTAAVLAQLATHGLASGAEFFRRASACLARDPEAALPGPVLVHGYADATGVQADLLRDLLVYAGARVVVDRPPDPARPEQEDLGGRYAERLQLRLGAAAPEFRETPFEPTSPSLASASGAHGEARAVAERIRAALDEGVPAERIGVVARQLEPYLAPLRIQLRRLGIPQSGAPDARGPVGPGGRRLRALLELLARRERTSTDRWLDAQPDLDPRRRDELGLAFHTLGAARLADLVALDLAPHLEGGKLPLPVRRGLREQDGREQRMRQKVERERLEAAIARARALQERFARWRDPRSLAAHRAELAGLVADLGGVGEAELAELADEVGASLPEDLPLDFEEFRLLVDAAVDQRGCLPPGGAGAGVALLSVTDARARSFERLYVLGMNRDGFPRVVSEDPLLPDPWRRRIETLVPDIPLKLRGHDEERFLFAQLVSASPEVTLLWSAVDDDGRERNPSPFVERIRLGAGGRREAVTHWPAPLSPKATGLVTSAEAAMRAGLARSPGLALLLADALGEARRELGLADEPERLTALAATRLRVLAEFEGQARAPGAPRELGPYFGFIGPRNPDEVLAVTFYESLAFCPWKAFLERRLGLEAVPDALAELPEVTPLLRGILLHAVLERIATRAGVPSGVPLVELASKTPCTVEWPTDLAALVQAEAERVVRAEGIGLPGFARLLAAAVLPALEAVGRRDWAAGSRDDILGVETLGELPWPPAREEFRVSFRADRADAGSEDQVLTDYKGTPFGSRATRPETRLKHLLVEMRHGKRLQGYVYAAASGRGRYVFPASDPTDPAEEIAIDAEDGIAAGAFARALATLRSAWLEGGLPPRLLSDDRRASFRSCEYCGVSEACLQGDSSSVRRLRDWLAEPPRARSDAETSARAVADLPTTSLEGAAS